MTRLRASVRCIRGSFDRLIQAGSYFRTHSASNSPREFTSNRR
jgi:hypothetical protein